MQNAWKRSRSRLVFCSKFDTFHMVEKFKRSVQERRKSSKVWLRWNIEGDKMGAVALLQRNELHEKLYIQ